MKIELEAWQMGAIIGLIIGLIVSVTSVEFVAMLQIPTAVLIAIFIIIGALIGNKKK